MTELEAMVEQLPEELRPCVRKRDDGAVEIELDRSMISGPVGFYVGMAFRDRVPAGAAGMHLPKEVV